MKSRYVPLLFSTLGIFLATSLTQAQTPPSSTRTPVADNTLGTQVSGANKDFTITGGLNRGQNLFHSFQDFSVPTGGSATFNNPLGNRAIITRVTGSNFSDIDGLVNTQGANFFLINPNGMVFGKNTQLNVGQTFVGSTANGIDLVEAGGNSYRFGTSGNDAPLLTIGPNALLAPTQLIMGGGKGEITSLGTLKTDNPGQYIGLIGGNVNLNGGKIIASGGRVDLGGLKSTGIVTATEQGLVFSGNDSIRSDVFITNKSLVDISPITTTPPITTFSNSSSASKIEIGARELKITNSTISSNTFDSSVAGDINFYSFSDITIANSFISSNNFDFTGIGNAGKITIRSDGKLLLDRGQVQSAKSDDAIQINSTTLELKNNSQIGSTLFADGNSGNIKIDTNGDITISGSSTIVSSNLLGNGNNGKISVDTNGHNLLLIDNASISNSLGLNLAGNSGGIYLNVNKLELIDSQIVTDSLLGTGNPGNITIIAKEVIIYANPSRVSRIASNSEGTAGDISLEGKKLRIDNGQIIAIANSGRGGNITLTLSDELLFRNNSIISTTSGTLSGGGDGGNINITVPFIVTSPNENSDISANAFSGIGGRVTIDTKQNFWIVPLSRAELEQLLGLTDPNLIDPGLLRSNDITAISQANPNLSGQVTIAPPEVDPSRGLSPLPNTAVDLVNQINPNCSPKALANNSFTSVGKGGLPDDPRKPLQQEPLVSSWVKLNPQDKQPSTPVASLPTTPQPQPLVEASGWRRERNGDVVLFASNSAATLPQPPSGCVAR